MLKKTLLAFHFVFIFKMVLQPICFCNTRISSDSNCHVNVNERSDQVVVPGVGANGGTAECSATLVYSKQFRDAYFINEQVNLPFLSSGIYNISITTTKGNNSRKLMIIQ